MNAAEFVDYLVGKGCGQQEATTSFEELDTEGEGMVDVTYCLSVGHPEYPASLINSHNGDILPSTWQLVGNYLRAL